MLIIYLLGILAQKRLDSSMVALVIFIAIQKPMITILPIASEYAAVLQSRIDLRTNRVFLNL